MGSFNAVFTENDLHSGHCSFSESNLTDTTSQNQLQLRHKHCIILYLSIKNLTLSPDT